MAPYRLGRARVKVRVTVRARARAGVGAAVWLGVRVRVGPSSIWGSSAEHHPLLSVPSSVIGRHPTGSPDTTLVWGRMGAGVGAWVVIRMSLDFG